MKMLIVVSSKTGNTKLLAHGICDAIEGAVLVDAAAMPQDLADYDVVLLGFWCDRGRAPADIEAAASRLNGKRVGCFATLGGDPDTESARQWMQQTSQALVAKGKGNVLSATYLCRGRIDPVLFEQMTKMQGGVLSPEREARRLAAETHPDRMDVWRAVEVFSKIV